MKKTIHILLIIAIMCASILFLHPSVSSAKDKDTTIDDVMTDADTFLNAGNDTNITKSVKGSNNELHNFSNLIYNTLLGIAIVAAVAIGMVIGIKFMLAAAEEKAQLKELLVPYIISCIVIFGAFGIWKLAVNVLNTWN